MINNFRTAVTKHQQNKEQGFTLIEILVVILIIGVLSAIAIPAFLNQRASAIDAGLKSDMKNMALELGTWQISSKASVTTLPRHPDLNGWTIVAQNSSDNSFVGLGAKTTNYAPDGFDLPKVSPGVALGVLTNPVVTNGGYCIVGNSTGGSYEPKGTPPEGMSNFAFALSKSLFYDSIAGGLLESSELSPTGACQNYQKRIQSGV